MRPAALVLRLLPLAGGAFFSLATSAPEPTMVTCDPVAEPAPHPGLEIGAHANANANEPDAHHFRAWTDGAEVKVQGDEATGPILAYRLHLVDAPAPECVGQLVVVSDAAGTELGRLDAALAVAPDAYGQQVTFDASVFLSRWPEAGEELTVEATAGQTTIAVVLVNSTPAR